VIVSATTGLGIDELIDTIEFCLSPKRRPHEIRLSLDQGRERAWLHEHTIIISESYVNNFILISCEMDEQSHSRWVSINGQSSKQVN